MKLLPDKMLVPLSVVTSLLLGFGAVSFKVGSFYSRATQDSETVVELTTDVARIKSDLAQNTFRVENVQADVGKIKSDVGRILTKVRTLTPQAYSLGELPRREEYQWQQFKR